MSTYLVTGVAGFIASKVAEQLLEAGHSVVGVDNLNDYYDVRLKDYRLSELLGAGSKELGADPKKSVLAGVGRVVPNAPGSEATANPLQLGADPKKSVFAGVGRVVPNAPEGSGALGTTRPTFEFHHLDIENLPALDALFAAHKFDAVFNLAARAGVRASLENPAIYHSTNVVGEENVLKCQVKYGVRKHVLASSSSVYAGCPMPFREDMELGKMQSPYAETKRAAELLAKDYHEKHGLDVTVLRYFTVFGPAGRPDMAPFRFIKWIDEGTPITLYGDGSAARDFTYIDDIARGTILAGRLFGGQLKADSGKLKAEGNYAKPASGTSAFSFQPSAFSVVAPRYDVVNLGGGNRPLTINAMIGMIEAELNVGRYTLGGTSEPVKAKVDYKPASPADMDATAADIAKAKRLLGWSPATPPVEGFKKAVQWYGQNRDWLVQIKA